MERQVKRNNVKSAFQEMVEKKIAKSAVLPTMSFETAKKYTDDLVENLAIERDAEVHMLLRNQLSAIADIFGINVQQLLNRAKLIAKDKAGLTCQLDELQELKTLLIYQREDEIDEESKELIDKMVSDIDFVVSI